MNESPDSEVIKTPSPKLPNTASEFLTLQKERQLDFEDSKERDLRNWTKKVGDAGVYQKLLMLLAVLCNFSASASGTYITSFTAADPVPECLYHIFTLIETQKAKNGNFAPNLKLVPSSQKEKAA